MDNLISGTGVIVPPSIIPDSPRPTSSIWSESRESWYSVKRNCGGCGGYGRYCGNGGHDCGRRCPSWRCGDVCGGDCCGGRSRKERKGNCKSKGTGKGQKKYKKKGKYKGKEKEHEPCCHCRGCCTPLPPPRCRGHVVAADRAPYCDSESGSDCDCDSDDGGDDDNEHQRGAVGGDKSAHRWMERIGLEDLIYLLAKKRRHNRDAERRVDDWVRVMEGLDRDGEGWRKGHRRIRTRTSRWTTLWRRPEGSRRARDEEDVEDVVRRRVQREMDRR